MGTLTRDCPRCLSKRTTFNAFADFTVPHRSAGEAMMLVAFTCGSCHGGYFAEFSFSSGERPANFKGNLHLATHMKLIDEYPIQESIECPKYVPENVEKFYMQSANSLAAKLYDASSMMSRKVLEVAVKALNPSGSGKLYHRIEQLYSAGAITEDLKDWAHIIRDDGNEAAHEEEPVAEEHAKELLSFCEIFLMYTFTMPGMVNAKRNE